MIFLAEHLQLKTPEGALVCRWPEHYVRLVRILKNKHKQRRELQTREFDDPWNIWVIMTLRNWMVALIKARMYEEAETQIRTHRIEAEEHISAHLNAFGVVQGNASVAYLMLSCLLTSCLTLTTDSVRWQEAKDEFEILYHKIVVDRQKGPVSALFDRQKDPILAEFEELKWIRSRGRDYHVLRESFDFDQVSYLERVKYYAEVPRCNDRTTSYTAPLADTRPAAPWWTR